MAVLESYTARTKELFRKYGRIGVGVHLAIYAATLTGCYVAAERNSKLEDLLVRHGLLARDELEADTEGGKGWLAWTSSSSSLALAFLCTKALLPVRVPLTFAITPPLARILRGGKPVAEQAAHKVPNKKPPNGTQM